MSNDEKWIDGIAKDNVFHRRLSDLRNTSINQDHIAALEELNKPRQQTMFSSPEPRKKTILSHDDVIRIAFYDDGTQAYNFRYLVRRLEREIKRSKRYNRAVSVMIVAVEGFDKIEESYGVTALDLAVSTVADMLIDLTRQEVDMVARYGNNKFVLMLPETPGSGAAILAERIRKKIEVTPVEYRWHKLYVEGSIGIAYFPGIGSDAGELIAKADLATDMVLEKGGNGTAFCPV
ncbi:diguanylate cyclase [bacterium]|nr:diguanylate cyclase [bacterium]